MQDGTLVISWDPQTLLHAPFRSPRRDEILVATLYTTLKAASVPSRRPCYCAVLPYSHSQYGQSVGLHDIELQWQGVQSCTQDVAVGLLQVDRVGVFPVYMG